MGLGRGLPLTRYASFAGDGDGFALRDDLADLDGRGAVREVEVEARGTVAVIDDDVVG